ncbi:hypothetical protein ACEQ8H_000776 [Pleosporales sp. CAS-2024a]
MTATHIFTVFAAILALAGAYLYFFGIDPETKRQLERKALKTMGENKMSYLAKDQINKIPTSDQQDIRNLKKGLGNAVGGITNNPVGEQTGETADRLTAPFTGR